MKKKGLIVATIVMVLVLAVSLTTATYAWFSSTASVTVSNLAISAQATDGLEIALKTTTHDNKYTTGYTYGAVDYDPTTGYWTSTDENDGFGSNLDFAEVKVGQISDAVTNQAATGAGIPTAAKFVYTIQDPQPTSGDTLDSDDFIVYADGSIKQCGGEGFTTVPATGAPTYYTRAVVQDGTYYKPTGYDANVQPYGFFAVTPNGAGTYYDLPIRIKSTTDVKAIVCSLKINSTATGAFAPGMAAATRVKIGFRKGESGNEAVYTGFEPYASATAGIGGMTSVVAAENELAFVVALAGTAGDVSSTDVYTLHVILWVEGTDNECSNYTTSATNFTVDFDFKYTKTAGDISSTKVTISEKEYSILTDYTLVNDTNP